ncbi:MAG: STAS domain-containing protein [Cyanobacteria bacterium P01_G01_bin.54]
MNSEIKTVEPAGILDGMRAAEFRQEITEYVEQGAKIVLIDFKDVTFMDSSGLGALVLSLKTVRAAKIKMCLCSINDQIKMLFELTSMDRVFEIYDDREAFEAAMTAASDKG